MSNISTVVRNQAINPLVALVNGRPTTTSNVIAGVFGKRHDRVLRAIRNLECSPDFYALNFGEIQTDVDLGLGRTRKDPAYEVTKDGFAFLAMGFTGKEAAAWKEKYINAFNLMESEIHRIQYSVNRNDALTAGQAVQIRDLLRLHCDKLPKAQQGAFMIKGWSKLKSHFGVPYRKIPQFELSEALSLIARHTTEWELLEGPKVPSPPALSKKDGAYLNVMALSSLMMLGREYWQELYPALVQMESPFASKFFDIFSTGNILAGMTIAAFAEEIRDAESRIPVEHRKPEAPGSKYLASLKPTADAVAQSQYGN